MNQELNRDITATSTLSDHDQGMTFANTQDRSRWIVWGIILLALLTRLAFVLIIDPNPHISGGDTDFLLTYGKMLVTGTLTVSPATGPTYLVFAGLIQTIFNAAQTLTVIRVLNALMGAALCGFIAVIGRRAFTLRIGLLAAFILAIDPAFVIEAGNVLTESLFLFLVFGALALYSAQQDKPTSRMLVAVGLLLGLATLTRAVGMLLPLVLMIHLAIMYRQRALRWIGILMIAYAATVATWTVYNLVRWQHFVIGAEGLAANVYLGTTNWCGPTCVDQSAGITNGDNQSKYISNTAATVSSDPLGYIRHRISNLADSVLQPYNTVYFPGASIKALFADWWQGGHPLTGLPRLFAADYFVPKLTLYVFHYAALIFGVIGLLIGLRHIRSRMDRLPAYGVVAYFLALHSILTAIPRYLFPIEPLLWLFAAYALVTLWITLRAALTHPEREAFGGRNNGTTTQ